MKKIILAMLLGVSLVTTAPAVAAPVPAKGTPSAAVGVTGGLTPLQTIKDLDKTADQYRVGKNLSAADVAFNKELKQKVLRGSFDLRELARLALDKHWNERTPKEQDAFVNLLTNLLEERSLLSKERATEKGSSQPYSIRYKGESFTKPDKTEALVKTVVDIKSKDLRLDLNYKLRKVGTIWKIYDVIMDDASLLENYRYTFGMIIKKNGYPELVKRMQGKLDTFRSKRK